MTTTIPAVFVLVRDGNKILLLLRQNTGWKDGHYTMPAGHVEARESSKTAAQRELLEEVGLTIGQDNLRHRLTIHEINPTEERFGLMFEAVDWAGEPYNAEPEKSGGIAWFEIDNLPDNIVPQAKFALEQIAAGNSYAEYGWDLHA